MKTRNMIFSLAAATLVTSASFVATVQAASVLRHSLIEQQTMDLREGVFKVHSRGVERQAYYRTHNEIADGTTKYKEQENRRFLEKNSQGKSFR